MREDKINLNFKIKIENIDKVYEKVEKLKELVKEINETELMVKVEPDELKDLNDCAHQNKKSGLNT